MASSILQSEIFEQPAVISELLASEKDNVSYIAKDLRGTFKYIVIAARGSSDNAARYAQYLLAAHNHLQIALATPSIFTIYESAPDLSEALVIGISQSGQSPDIVSVIAEAKKQGRPTLVITNETESHLAQSADYVIPLHAGSEKATAATKTYTSSLAAMALFSSCLMDDCRNYEELIKVPAAMNKTLATLEPTMIHFERYRYMEHCDVIGRGYNYATAFEIALKVKELTRVVAEPYSSADFRHGPIATVQIGFPVIIVAPHGAVYKDMLDLALYLKKLNAEMLVVSDESEILNLGTLPLPISPELPEWLTPLVAVIPGQLLGMRLATEKGFNADQPSGLTKITETI
jgi:glucosamine--fructose-6-phosphate aminotransferase (isomerizing)